MASAGTRFLLGADGTSVVSMKTGEWDVRIDGQSKWGNPFRIGRTVALLLFTPDDAILTAIL